MRDKPNLDTIKAFRPQMQAIHNFLEYMEEQGYGLVHRDNRLDGIPSSGQKLDRHLADFYNFDYDEAENERQRIIDSL